jgi:UDP-2-acetamido-2,6-beta-L-arabino-hexul-4-ose reductase
MPHPVCRVLVTGSRGFIGRNLAVRLSELPGYAVTRFDRGDDPSLLPQLVARADVVVHLAGENRPADERAFAEVNVGLTASLCAAITAQTRATDGHVPIILASSSQAAGATPYGVSKRGAEREVHALGAATGNPGVIFRLPGVFGKWCQPNYNSVVATFCHNIAHGVEIRIDNPAAPLRLVYIDDVIDAILAAINAPQPGVHFGTVTPEYEIGLGELAAQLEAFHSLREALGVAQVGAGLTRALYATYLSYLPQTRFSYAIPQHRDDRGRFVEMLKTPDCGQVNILTAPPGATRGGHYHHTKVEKFLVIKGSATFRFRHILTDERVEICTSGDAPQVVETIPGWSHDITNIGSEEMVVILWANEVFDRNRPDTITSKV